MGTGFTEVGRPASNVLSLIVTLKSRLESEGDFVVLSSALCRSVRSEATENAGEIGRKVSDWVSSPSIAKIGT